MDPDANQHAGHYCAEMQNLPAAPAAKGEWGRRLAIGFLAVSTGVQGRWWGSVGR